MGFKRATVFDGGLQRPARGGDGIYGQNYSPTAITADANSTITAAMIAGGLVLRSGMTANRTDTSDTAVNILGAFPEMDIGDTLTFKVSNTSGFSSILAGGTGVTASGNLTVLTLTAKEVVLTKTSATTMTMVAL